MESKGEVQGRFRIDELEERSAPTATGNPGNNNPGQNSTNNPGDQPPNGNSNHQGTPGGSRCTSESRVAGCAAPARAPRRARLGRNPGSSRLPDLISEAEM